MAALDAEGIDSRPMFHPLSSLPAYDGQVEAAVARKRNAVSYRLSPWGINLPSAMNLTRGASATRGRNFTPYSRRFMIR